MIHRFSSYGFLVAVFVCAMAGWASENASTNLMIHAHAHNDYEHERPLLDALDNNFYSVESDVFMVEGEILVAHDFGDWKGTLKDLYLDPLQARVDELGSVHGDGKPFYLWVDFKDGRPELWPVLNDLLTRYSMFSVFTDEWMQQGPVTVILTGSNSKIEMANTYAIRPYCYETAFSPDLPDADHSFRWHAISWRSLSEWRGNGPIPEADQAKVRDLVKAIHAKGRGVRIYAAPDTPAYWGFALDAGVDHINTDNLPDLAAFLKSKMQ